ncbi:aromatic ring-hydroxylating dioxygenase subunit alpha [Limnohabitans sp. WS1]|uniref:aromatic ring-hydroxylating dioxygenase subunit alpha n=1 Tax=Limnohabitans sp. WS1 TaxID=1100726 RepID=UPI000D3A9C37|nr:aromatic ring-hydroxylating dioxygenase subunit alpha [Limnohabitans sp. WS1]PUE21339.1 Rieske (2Fe-2S) protein [Limnohabitans sp. WS1]
MTRPLPPVIAAAQSASQRMADRHTPFVMNDWYVAAFGQEITDQLLARTLLGRRLVFYRTSAGQVVALEDRCPHRSMPLSAGTLEQDTIVCAYHGLRFNTEGDCIEVPSQATCPKNVGIRAYRTHERGAVVWIWMGEVEQADLSKLPPQDWMDSDDWERSQGYLGLQASYVRLHENLLDLTHLSFLHAKSFGTPDYAKAAFESEIGHGQFALLRNVVPTTLPPVWAVPTGLTGKGQAARIVRSEFRSLGLHEVSVTFYDCHLLENERPHYRIRTAHMPTPETATSTHYFIVHGRDFALQDPATTRFMHEQLFVAFQEDVDGLALQELALANTPAEDLYEFSVAADAPAVAMRRYVLARQQSEAQA